jgi:hypothetical protein
VQPAEPSKIDVVAQLFARAIERSEGFDKHEQMDANEL